MLRACRDVLASRRTLSRPAKYGVRRLVAVITLFTTYKIDKNSE
jgi:hypothetical protein